jgi:hypothetical protein
LLQFLFSEINNLKSPGKEKILRRYNKQLKAVSEYFGEEINITYTGNILTKRP